MSPWRAEPDEDTRVDRKSRRANEGKPSHKPDRSRQGEDDRRPPESDQRDVHFGEAALAL